VTQLAAVTKLWERREEVKEQSWKEASSKSYETAMRLVKAVMTKIVKHKQLEDGTSERKHRMTIETALKYT
jgi:hypothetical protein